MILINLICSFIINIGFIILGGFLAAVISLTTFRIKVMVRNKNPITIISLQAPAGITFPNQSEPGSNGNGVVLYIL